MPTPVTKEQYEKSLQPLHWPGALVTWISHRPWALSFMHRLSIFAIKGSKLDGFFNDEIFIPSTTTANHTIRARIYKPDDVTDEPLPVMIFMHGGGYQIGLPEQDHAFFKNILQRRNICIVAPDYRCTIVYNSPYPHGLNDCFDTVQYVKDHANELGVRSNNFVFAGHSAGGGMTLALTLKAVDTEVVDLAFIMPMYPMIDCRMNTRSAEMVGTWVWDCVSNKGAWGRYLANIPPGQDVPDYASPALREDVSNLPPTITFVGTLEPFLDEVKIFMNKLQAANIPTKFKVYEGGFHGFEVLGPTTDLGIEANNFQINSFAEFYDEFVAQGGK